MLIKVSDEISVDPDAKKMYVSGVVDVLSLYSTSKNAWSKSIVLLRHHFPLKLVEVPYQFVELRTINGWELVIDPDGTILPLRVEAFYQLK